MLPQVDACAGLDIEGDDDDDDDGASATPAAAQKPAISISVAPSPQPRVPPPKKDIETLVWEHQREIQRLSQAVRALEARTAAGAGITGPASSSSTTGVNLGRADCFSPAATGATTPSPPSSFKRSPTSSFKRQSTMPNLAAAEAATSSEAPATNVSPNSSPNSSFNKKNKDSPPSSFKRQNTAPIRKLGRSNSLVGFTHTHEVFASAGETPSPPKPLKKTNSLIWQNTPRPMLGRGVPGMGGSRAKMIEDEVKLENDTPLATYQATRMLLVSVSVSVLLVQVTPCNAM